MVAEVITKSHAILLKTTHLKVTKRPWEMKTFRKYESFDGVTKVYQNFTLKTFQANFFSASPIKVKSPGFLMFAGSIKKRH